MNAYDPAEQFARGERMGAQVERGRIFTDVERLIQRVVTSTLSSDVPGLGGVAPSPGTVVADQAARRAAPYRRLLDELSSVTLTPNSGGRPWCPTLEAPPAAGVQAGGEKTEFPSGAIRVSGGDVLPDLIGLTSNVSLQAWRAGEVAITALMTESTLRATVDWVLTQLQVGAAAATSIAEGVGLLEAAGWAATHIIGPASSLLVEDLQRLSLAGLTVLPVTTGGPTLVVSKTGTWVGSSDAVVSAVEPAIGGIAVTAFSWAVASAGPGSVAAIAGTGTTRKGTR